MPVVTDIPDYSSVSPPEMQTNLLLDNVAKIERKFIKKENYILTKI